MVKAAPLIFALFLAGCSQEKPVQPPPEPVAAEPVPDDNKILDYIDSLQLSVTRHKSLAALQKLDSVACISDGFMTEAVDAAAAHIWGQQFTLLIRYLHHHPESLLRPQLIWGLSANMYTEEDRATALANFKATALDSAHQAGLSKPEMVFLHQILSEVNPALLD